MEGADFFVEDLLDLSNGGGDDDMMTDAFLDSVAANSNESSALTPLSDSCNSSVSGGNPSPFFDSSHFSSELCVPCDDLEHLEWLSNFVEESFSTEDLHKFPIDPNQPGQAQFQTRQPNMNPNTQQQQQQLAVPAKARSKRSRVAPCDWSTRLLMVSNQNQPHSPATSSSSSDQGPTLGPKKVTKKREMNHNDGLNNGEVRRCLHCAAEKTPQWRTGPMGPKTLCNACGVRYKSGRLVPEYRPAASPTFMSTKHSNSHRKVMELRRQKDVQRHQPHQFIGHQHHHRHANMLMGVSNGADDYMIPHHLGQDYRQMI